MRTNYVMIDYENVQPSAIAMLDREYFKTMIFIGANQSKIDVEVAASLQKMGERAEYIRIAGSGSNALDFHIAYYIGAIAAREPDAYFHIVSKDKGFDPLIQHLKTRKVSCCRSHAVTEIPLLNAANSKTPDDKMNVITADLKRRGSSKPRTLKTLSTSINSLFKKQLSEPELDQILKDLEKKHLIVITENKVSYNLPE